MEARNNYGCYFFNERRAVQGTLILGIGPTIFATFKLMKMQDVFGIGPEIVRVIVPMVIVGGMSCQDAQPQTNVNPVMHRRWHKAALILPTPLLLWSNGYGQWQFNIRNMNIQTCA